MEHEVPTRTNSVMTEQLSRRTTRWKYNTGEDAGYLQLDEKTLEALLQLDIGCMFLMRSVDGRIWSLSLGIDGSDIEIPFFKNIQSNPEGKNFGRQYLAGSFSGALSFKAQNDADLTQNNAEGMLYVCALKLWRLRKFYPLQNK